MSERGHRRQRINWDDDEEDISPNEQTAVVDSEANTTSPKESRIRQETKDNHRSERSNRGKHEAGGRKRDQGGIASNLGTDHTSKKHKKELLHAKTVDEKHVNWEKEQFRKATQGSNIQSDEKIHVVADKEYEFVFDESQFVDFDEEEIIEGEDEETNEPKRVDLSERESLPVFSYREEFLELVKNNQFLVVVGETGSGKTTQLPQYLHEAGYSDSSDGTLMIGCTQPRRVAATSVAARVADEMGTSLGDQVGYTIRFEEKASKNTVVKYMTDGMLLREFLTDPTLAKYGALMIDEAHERTLSTEVLMCLLKGLAKTRPSLKIIIASATINAEKFSSFFGGAPILNIPGRRYPVEVHYTKSPEANYIQAAITTIFQVHITAKEKGGDILVFLTGQEEIEQMEEALNDAVNKLGTEIDPLVVCPIYANLPNEQQARIFEPTPPGSRKVVLATNIAETSITIPGVTYVIDPGYVKQNVYNPATGMDSLVVVPCSRASADQRAGRSGRMGPGKCFRLYTKWSFYNELESNPTPEILRTNLVSTLLLLLSLGITDLVHFDFMDPPSSEAIIKALELLYALGALSSSGTLTTLGRKMSELPIDPSFTKALICSDELGVFDDVLSVVSILGESSTLFYRPKDKKEQADNAKERFTDPSGDHLTLLRVWKEWVGTGYSVQWCQDHFIQYKTMKRAKNIREQLLRLSKKIGIEGKQNSGDTSQVQKAIVAGFFPHIVRLSQMGDSYRRLKKNQVVNVHPSSVIYPVKPPPKLLLYHELVLTSKEYMRNCMTVEEDWVKEYGKHYYGVNDLKFLDKKSKYQERTEKI